MGGGLQRLWEESEDVSCDGTTHCRHDTERVGRLNNIVFMDGVQYTKVLACANVAAALPSPGTCYVPMRTSASFTSGSNKVEMASGVSRWDLDQACSVIRGANGSGVFIFVHFASGVTGAAVKGRGIGLTRRFSKIALVGRNSES